MRFITITVFSVTGSLVSLAIAKPIPNWKAGGIAIPLAIHSPFLKSEGIDLDAINSQGIYVREKILSGLDNYERNTVTMHPFAVERRESELRTRGDSLPLTAYRNLIWSGEISIGTPSKTLKVQIDTGSALAVPGFPAIATRVWDPDSSKFAKKEEMSFLFKYSDGSIVKGDRYTDNVTIAGFTADPQTFGSATSYTSHLQTYEYPADGLLGLAFPSVSKFDGYPLFVSLVRQKRVIHPTFSLKLSSSGAEMYIGGANSMLYNGNINIAFTPVTYPALWQVSIDDVRVNGNTILENVPAILDTGASYIFGDWERVSELYRSLDATLKEHINFGYSYLPCDSFPTVSFTFGGRAFEIPPDAIILGEIAKGSPYCFSAIVAQRSRIGEISEPIAPRTPF